MSDEEPDDASTEEVTDLSSRYVSCILTSVAIEGMKSMDGDQIS